MVFVHDAPPSILLAEPHGEAKFEVDFLACAQVAASANRSGKGHLGPRCHSDVVKIELHRPGRPVVERGICGTDGYLRDGVFAGRGGVDPLIETARNRDSCGWLLGALQQQG